MDLLIIKKANTKGQRSTWKNNNVKQPFVSSNPTKISALDDRAIETLREFNEKDAIQMHQILKWQKHWRNSMKIYSDVFNFPWCYSNVLKNPIQIKIKNDHQKLCAWTVTWECWCKKLLKKILVKEFNTSKERNKSQKKSKRLEKMQSIFEKTIIFFKTTKIYNHHFFF